MKERPIFFTPENAQKVHLGTKTQTRRICKPQPLADARRGIMELLTCPYGKPGDRLWVRESGWMPPPISIRMLREGADTWPKFIYNADGDDRNWCKEYKWKSTPSIHMPRWACRTVLELTAVCVERLQEISEADAIAEGIEYHNGMGIGRSGYRHSRDHGFVYLTAREAYSALWESINGKGSWALNPWVRVLIFKRLEGMR